MEFHRLALSPVLSTFLRRLDFEANILRLKIDADLFFLGYTLHRQTVWLRIVARETGPFWQIIVRLKMGAAKTC